MADNEKTLLQSFNASSRGLDALGIKSAVDVGGNPNVAEMQGRVPIWAGSRLGLAGALVTPGGGVADLGGVAAGTVTGATTADSSSPIVITVTSHPFSTGDILLLASIGGATEANGVWKITKIDANTFSLDGSEAVTLTTYTSGGTATLAEQRLAPAATEYFIVDQLRLLITDDASELIEDGYPATVLSAGMDLKVFGSDFNESGAAETGVDGRTVEKQLNPISITAVEDWQLLGELQLPINDATGNTFVAVVVIDFADPLIIDGTEGEYLALHLGVALPALEKHIMTARGWIGKKS